MALSSSNAADSKPFISLDLQRIQQAVETHFQNIIHTQMTRAL